MATSPVNHYATLQWGGEDDVQQPRKLPQQQMRCQARSDQPETNFNCVVLVLLAVRLFQLQRGYDMKLSCCVVFVLCVCVAVYEFSLSFG